MGNLTDKYLTDALNPSIKDLKSIQAAEIPADELKLKKEAAKHIDMALKILKKVKKPHANRSIQTLESQIRNLTDLEAIKYTR
jgi:hypothetical protein